MIYELRKFYKWVKQFKNGRVSVTEENCSGRPDEVSTPSIETRIYDIIHADRRINVEIIVDNI